MDRVTEAAVPRRLLWPLWVALGGGVVFMMIATAQGSLRPDYDSLHQSVSALSLGPGGWVQVVNFVMLGTLIIITVPAWRRILAGGPGATWYPILTAVVAVSFILAGLIPQDPAPGYDPEGLGLDAPTARGLAHLAVAGLASTSCVAGLFVMAARFDGQAGWRRWATYSRLMALLMIASVIVYAVWSVRPSGLAGTFERVAIMIPQIWGFTVIWRLHAATPFMIGIPQHEAALSPRTPAAP